MSRPILLYKTWSYTLYSLEDPTVRMTFEMKAKQLQDVVEHIEITKNLDDWAIHSITIKGRAPRER